MPSILWTTDTQLRVTYAIGAGMLVLGRQATDYLGKTLAEILETDDPNSEPIAAHRRALEGQRASYEHTVAGRHLDVRVEPLHDQADEIVGCVGVAIDVTEQKRAEAELQRSRELATLRTLTASVSQSIELSEVVATLGDLLTEELGLAGGALFFCDGDTDHYTLEALLGLPDGVRSVVGAQINMVFDAVNMSQRSEAWVQETDWRSWEAGLELHSCVAIPLRATNNPLGALVVFGTEPEAFGDRQVAFLEALARQVSFAIQNARLYHAEQRAHHTADALRSANLALTRTLELDAVLDTLLDSLHSLTQYDSASVLLRTGASQLQVRAIRGYDKWVAEPDRVLDIGFEISSAPMFEEIIQQKASVVVPDTLNRPGWQRCLGLQHVRSWLGVPLVAGGETIGLYALDKTEPGYFTDEHIRLAEALAPQAAVAIQNARLFAEVRNSREHMRQLTQSVVDIQEKERRRLSRELHDEAGQALTALKINLEMIEAAMPPEYARLRAQLGEAVQVADATMERMRRLAHDLRPPGLDTAGLNPTLEDLCHQFACRTGLAVDFVGSQVPILPDPVGITLYRVLQEALTNVARHAGASRVSAVLRYDGQAVTLAIEDDGSGFDPEAVLTSAGEPSTIGLLGMQERIEILNGDLIIDSASGQGTLLVARLPVQDVP